MSKAARGFQMKALHMYSAWKPENQFNWRNASSNDNAIYLKDWPATKRVVIRDLDELEGLDFVKKYTRREQYFREIVDWCKQHGFALVNQPTRVVDENGKPVYALCFRKTKHAVMAKLTWG